MKTEEKILRSGLIYILVLTLIMVLTSCGSSKHYHVGTGKPLSKHSCTGAWIGGQ